jgi:hypothetical protein
MVAKLLAAGATRLDWVRFESLQRPAMGTQNGSDFYADVEVMTYQNRESPYNIESSTAACWKTLKCLRGVLQLATE